uniref:Uncharacterized protein n=1 Tax=Anopheles coluzzii TaxID=1518534 RepID=A0A8W7Q0C9_ANOCL
MNKDLNATVSNVERRTSNKQQQQQRQSRDTVQQQQCTEPSQIGCDEGNGAAPPPPQAATDAETANDDNGVPTPGKQPCSSARSEGLRRQQQARYAPTPPVVSSPASGS